MRGLGAALLFLGAALVRAAYLGERRRERCALREMVQALAYLEQGVRVLHLPLPRLLERQGGGRYADGFFARILEKHTALPDCPLPECWRAAALTLPLPTREREAICRLADALGGEEEDLLRALGGGARQLQKALEAMEEKSGQEERLITAVCMSGGALTAILLL